jgi:hypothetical protein
MTSDVRRPFRAALLTIALASCLAPVHAARYTYHGDLMDGDTPADGLFDLRVRALATPNAKAALAAPTELPDVRVVDGRFSVEVDLPEATGSTTWVEVAIRPKGTTHYEVLGEPRAISKANSTCPGAWALDGNTGVPAGSFLGLADPASAAALELRARNLIVARFTPSGTIDDYGDASRVSLGSSGNFAGAFGATVGGGGATREGGTPCPTCVNVAGGLFATASGGIGNRAIGDASTVAGGERIVATGNGSTVAGGSGNVAGGTISSIGGGSQNDAGGLGGSIGGGAANVVARDYSTVAGGLSNEARDVGAAIGGGQNNIATSPYATVPGGYGNRAVGARSLAAGGSSCAGGNGSVALGDKAETRAGNGASNVGCASGVNSGDPDGDEGTFAYADTGVTSFLSTGPNQFNIRARGGVGINTAPPNSTVEVTIQADADDGDYANLWLKQKSANANGVMLSVGDGGGVNNASFYVDHFSGAAQARRMELLGTGAVTIRSNVTQANTGVTMAANAGSWSSLSDRRLKTAIELVDAGEILDRLLATPISTWSYIAQGEGVRHIGPMAQDFAAAFGLGENDTTISTIDADGVALAAIQGLNRKLELENADLRDTVDQLARRLARLEANAERAR